MVKLLEYIRVSFVETQSDSYNGKNETDIVHGNAQISRKRGKIKLTVNGVRKRSYFCGWS
jgi:hypothetical protein